MFWYSEMVLIRLEFSSSIFWIVAALAGGLLGPPGPLVAGGPAAGPLGPGGPTHESSSQPCGECSCKHNYTLSYRQAYFLPLNSEVGLPGHQRGQDSILEVKHLAQEDLCQSESVLLQQHTQIYPLRDIYLQHCKREQKKIGKTQA